MCLTPRLNSTGLKPAMCLATQHPGGIFGAIYWSLHSKHSYVIPSEWDRDWAERRPPPAAAGRNVAQVGEILRSEPDWHSAQDDNA
jgi:hypothetical protein